LEEQLRLRGVVSRQAESAKKAMEIQQQTGNSNAFAVFDFGIDENELTNFLSIEARGLESLKKRCLFLVGTQKMLHAVEKLYPVLLKPYRQSTLYRTMAHLMGEETVISETSRCRESCLGMDGLGKVRVLVAEDNPVNQRVAKKILDRLGVSADVVSNGLEALEALDKVHYGAVLMDCLMPEMDGFEATRKIRALSSDSARVPIVAMTANALPGDKEKCLDAGFSDYLSKPVTKDSVRDKLLRWLQPALSTVVPLHSENTPKAAKAINPQVMESLKSLRGEGEGDFLTELIDLFLEHAPATLEEIETAVKEKNVDKIVSQSHRLKGFAANLGAESLVAVCAHLEGEGRKRKLECSERALESIKQEFNRAKIELLEQWSDGSSRDLKRGMA
jgi:CheY-like chemotaxis protein